MSSTTLEQKHLIARLHGEGRTAREIADEVGLSVWTVRKWLGRIKKSLSRNLLWGAQREARWAATPLSWAA